MNQDDLIDKKLEKLLGDQGYKAGRNPLRSCPLCGIEFPDHLIRPLCLNAKTLTACPICALEKINEVDRRGFRNGRDGNAKAN